jgi:hypothetical protein
VFALARNPEKGESNSCTLVGHLGRFLLWSPFLKFYEVSIPRLFFENLRFDSFIQSLIMKQEFLEQMLLGFSIKGLSVVQLWA